jgi:hypothetical protein
MNKELENTLKKTIATLERARETAESNVNHMYWTNIKMHNNRKQFAPEQITKGMELEKELSSLVDYYDRMLFLLNESMQISDQTEADSLWEKLMTCLQEGKFCLDRQKVIQQDVLDLESSLEQKKRGWGARLWT